MANAITDAELRYRALQAVASQFSYKPDPVAHARVLLAKGPQLWAAEIAERELANDGYRATKRRKDVIWKALGGK